MKLCKKCGVEKEAGDFYRRFDRSSRSRISWCKKCLNDATKHRQLQNKLRAVELKGGKCQFCGYSKCLGALEFHHPDRSKKTRDIVRLRSCGWARFWKEAKDCILLCANCHREEEERVSKTLSSNA